MSKRLVAIRGATCTKNTPEDITNDVCRMCGELLSRNSLSMGDIVSVQFTVTPGLDALNPASALRRGNAGSDFSSVALFCALEPPMQGGMKDVIRVMVTAYLDEDAKKHNVYQNGAERLRPDYSDGGAA